MRTTDFLRELLPESGIYYAATWVKNPKYGRGGYWKHTPTHTIEQLTPELKHLSSQGQDAYFALASFEQAHYQDPETGKTRWRTQENAICARAAWLDLDVGESKGYATQKAALVALRDFVRDCELPGPTHIVSSGNGIHVYWAFTKDVPKALWEQFARYFKALTEFKGLLADPTRTADIASVLRPIGTQNFKDPDNPKDVVLLKRRDECQIRFSDWGARISELRRELNLEVKTKRTSQTSSKNAGLTSKGPPPPSDADQLAERCLTLGDMKACLGAGQSEPLWHACLGVLAFTVQGDEVCHQWSAAHESYDEALVQAKIEQVRERQSGPTGCATIRQRDGNRCGECTLKKVTNPIILGYPDAPQPTIEPETGEALPEIPLSMRKEFGYELGNGMVWVQPNKKEDGSDDPVPLKTTISKQFVVLDYVYKDGNDEFVAKIRARAKPGEWHDARIPVAVIATGGQGLMTALGKAGVTGHEKGLSRYMQTWYEQTRATVSPQNMRRTMGWQEDGSFVLGDEIYMPDGSVEDCTLTKDVAKYAEGHRTQGVLPKQIDLIDHLYNRRGMEAWQFVLTSSLGSALLSLIHPGPVGIPISIWEQRGGKGKTTVCKAAISLWGNPNGHGQGASANGITEHALYVLSGMRRHLPVLIDETTMWDDSVQVAKFAYRFSSGMAKVQGAAEGGLRQNTDQNWQSFLYTTANRSLTGTISAAIPNCGPQLARVFEIEFPQIELDAVNDSDVVTELWGNTGHIGREFLKAIVKRKDTVEKMLKAEQKRLRTLVDSDTDARYWLMTAACTIVAGKIAHKLGLLKFDMDRLTQWTERQVKILRSEQNEAALSDEEVLGKLFFELQPGILITDKLGGRSTRVMISQEFPAPRSREIVGRYAVNEGTLWISVAGIKSWCVRNNLDYKDLRQRIDRTGRLLRHDERMYLSVGTSLGGVAQARCWRIKAPNMGISLVGVDEGGVMSDTEASSN